MRPALLECRIRVPPSDCVAENAEQAACCCENRHSRKDKAERRGSPGPRELLEVHVLECLNFDDPDGWMRR